MAPDITGFNHSSLTARTVPQEASSPQAVATTSHITQTNTPYGAIIAEGQGAPADFPSGALGAPHQMSYMTLPTISAPDLMPMPQDAMFPQEMVADPHALYHNDQSTNNYEPVGQINQATFYPQAMATTPQTFSAADFDHSDNRAMSTSEAGPSRQLPADLLASHEASWASATGQIAPQALSFRTMIPQTSGEASSGPSSIMNASALDILPVISTAEDIKPLLLERLPKNQPGSVYKRYIRSVADFDQQSHLYRSLSFKRPGYAGDFPQRDDELENLAKGLTDAMTNMDGTVEAGKKSVVRIHQLSPYEIVLKSWKLLFTLRDVQLGQVDLHLWGAEWDGETFNTFMARYEDVRAKLHMSKSLVSNLFDQEFSVRLALNPAAEYRKKIANYKNNSRRAIDLAEARASKRSLDNGEGGSAAPPKRRRSSGLEDEQGQDFDQEAYADADSLLASGVSDYTDAELLEFFA